MACIRVTIPDTKNRVLRISLIATLPWVRQSAGANTSGIDAVAPNIVR